MSTYVCSSCDVVVATDDTEPGREYQTICNDCIILDDDNLIEYRRLRKEQFHA